MRRGSTLYYNKGYRGECLMTSDKCIKRYLMGKDGKYNNEPVSIKSQTWLKVGSDGTSCTCNEEAGYCFSKLTNGCERFTFIPGKQRKDGVKYLPPEAKRILIKGKYNNIWFGSGEDNFCTESTDPFTGPGCRIWRKNHQCKGMIGLHAVARTNRIEDCLKLAEAEKKCHTLNGGGKIILLPASSSHSMQQCFCSTNACSDNHTHPNGHYQTFACGSNITVTTTTTAKPTTTTEMPTTTEETRRRRRRRRRSAGAPSKSKQEKDGPNEEDDDSDDNDDNDNDDN